MANPTSMFPSSCELGDDLVHFGSLVIDAHKLGYLRLENWRIGGWGERLNMRTAIDCAWMLDGAMGNCVYALSLASRDFRRGKCFKEVILKRGFESTPSSRFHELPRMESSRLVHEPIRFYSDFKFNVQNTLRVDSSSSESILKSNNLFLKAEQ
ncbi:hypothetical protein PIB30_029708 [Stylosanthes scabra]|uniref:Uncharacterized protein n=1 Tax=Stylosanthes scabra TaxID=79078 RepID=A0ABU6WBM2_9FABA|nr:hypothetical protein [Stylosanthes scabra]